MVRNRGKMNWEQAHTVRKVAKAHTETRLHLADLDGENCENCYRLMHRGEKCRKVSRADSPSGQPGYVHEPMDCLSIWSRND